MATVGLWLGASAGSAAAVGTFAVATAANVGLQVKQNQDVEKAQKRKQELERAKQSDEAQRSRRNVMKEAAVKRAQVENVAGATGQQQSSAAIAGTQQIESEAAANIGQINTAVGYSTAISNANQNIANARQTSPLQQIAGAVQQGSIAFKS